MENFERNVSINSIKFYNDVTNYIHHFRDVNILKQHYMQRSKTIAMRDNLNLPAKDTKAAVKCPRCCVNRTQINTIYKIVSPRSTRSRFLRRVNKMDSGNMTRYQLKCAKKIQDCFSNRLVIKCRICQTEYKEVLRKPNKDKVVKRKVSKQKVPQIQNRIEQKLIMTKLKVNMKKNKKQKQKMKQKMDEKIGKLNKLLNMSHQPRKTNLKAFIKSVT